MFKKAGVLFLYTETPLHPGSGASLGLADLPVQREKATNYPIMQPSGIKGVFRDFIGEQEFELGGEKTSLNKISRELAGLREQLSQAKDDQKSQLEAQIKDLEEKRKRLLYESGIQAVFGPETDEADTHSGAISFTEARIILFPVRSLLGVFAWVTCPQVLARLQRDLKITEQSAPWEVPPQPAAGHAWIVQDSTVTDPTNKSIVLEEYTFTVDNSPKVQEIAEWLAQWAFPSDAAHAYWKNRLYEKNQGKVHSNLVILRDEDFRDFTLFGTEVITRIRIDPAKGTVPKGALWTEEHLPADTLLYTLALATDPRVADGQLPENLKKNRRGSAEKVLEYLTTKVQGKLVQMGGDATVGRGLVHVRVLNTSQTGQGGSHAS